MDKVNKLIIYKIKASIKKDVINEKKKYYYFD